MPCSPMPLDLYRTTKQHHILCKLPRLLPADGRFERISVLNASDYSGTLRVFFYIVLVLAFDNMMMMIDYDDD